MIASRIALWRFENAQVSDAASGVSGVRSVGDVDVSLWSANRIQAYKESLLRHFDQPRGVLKISRLGLTAPVFDGTDDVTLNRGLGRIVGTTQLGDDGNAGIAGHRDGFFRVLKDIEAGDSIDLLLANRQLRYLVRSTEIVDPSDSEVLKATSQRELTLVTCYPFYFVGSAPKRFIVHAILVVSDRPTVDHRGIAAKTSVSQ